MSQQQSGVIIQHLRSCKLYVQGVICRPVSGRLLWQGSSESDEYLSDKQ
jgi:hypothetical protein